MRSPLDVVRGRSAPPPFGRIIDTIKTTCALFTRDAYTELSSTGYDGAFAYPEPESAPDAPLREIEFIPRMPVTLPEGMEALGEEYGFPRAECAGGISELKIFTNGDLRKPQQTIYIAGLLDRPRRRQPECRVRRSLPTGNTTTDTFEDSPGLTLEEKLTILSVSGLVQLVADVSNTFPRLQSGEEVVDALVKRLQVAGPIMLIGQDTAMNSRDEYLALHTLLGGSEANPKMEFPTLVPPPDSFAELIEGYRDSEPPYWLESVKDLTNSGELIRRIERALGRIATVEWDTTKEVARHNTPTSTLAIESGTPPSDA